MIGVQRDSDRRQLYIVLKGFPCVWNRCAFCSFSDEAAEDLEDILSTGAEVIREAEAEIASTPPEKLLVFCGGSFFELPLPLVAKLAPLARGRILAIESRPEYLTEKSLIRLSRLLDPRLLEVRIGFETISEGIRRALGKGIPNSEIERVVGLREALATTENTPPVKFLSYILFGLELVSEESVVESVKALNHLLDGVIAIRYRPYKAGMPKPSPVSERLLNFLSQNCLEVDLATSGLWEISGGRSS